MSGRVGVIIDGKLSVHMAGCVSDYDTACGIDAHDEGIGHSGLADPGQRRIDCHACARIWETARSYRASDFSTKSREGK